MSFTKFASLEETKVLDVKGAPTRQHTASLDKVADYHDYRTSDGYMYVRMRAISSRVNKNNDGWPTIELAGSPELFERHQSSDGGGFTIEASEGGEYGFATFMGKPHFVDHHNSDPKRARGVVVDAKFHMLGNSKEAALDEYYSSDEVDPEHMPPCEVELLIEVDAKSFPKLAQAIQNGDIDGFSMGCFVAGTPITLADGTKIPIEDIAVGDQVLTHAGRVEPVTHLMSHRYDGTTFTVHSYGQAQPVTATEEHPFWTKDGWVEAKDLKPGDWVYTPTIQGVDQPGEYRFARLLGYYLAEGNLGYDQKRYPDRRPVFVEWNFSTDEIDTLVKDTQLLLADLGYKACGPYIKHNCATVRVNSPELAQRFLDYGNQHSWDKRLSLEVLQWEPANQKELLNAYFNGDGHFSGSQQSHVKVGTASQHLASQLQLLATRVGYRMTPPIKQHSPSAQHKRAKYNIQATLGEPDGRTMHSMELVKDGLWRKIIKIEENVHNDLVYNFDVEGDDSYVAGDIAVHNCDVEKSKCSHCGNEATSPDEYCSHIVMKGAQMKVESGKHKGKSRKSYENCLTPDTPVLLQNGRMVPISFISIGDMVIDHLGEGRKVIEVDSRNVNEEIVEISRTGQGYDRPLKVTKNHPLLVVRGRGLKKNKIAASDPEFVEAGDLTEEDWIVEVLPRHNAVLKNILTPRLSRYVRQDIPASIDLDEDFGRWCGWYLAEGSISYNRLSSGERSESSVCFGLHVDEIAEREEILRLGAKIFGVTGKIEYSKVAKSAAVIFHNRPLAVFMSQFGTSSLSKALPVDLLNGPIDFINGVVGAHQSGDGHHNLDGERPNEILHCTSSATLADQLYDMNVWLGHTPSRRLDKPSPQNKRTIAGNIIAYQEVKQRSPRNRITGDWTLSKISRIDRVHYCGPVHNLEIDKTHTYVANGQAVHNCYGIKFFEISAVFDPADETALTKEVRASVHKEAENPLPQSDHTTAPAEVDTLRQEQVCPVCGSDMDKETCDVCGFVEPPKHFDNPNLEKAKLRDEALEMGGGQTTVPEDSQSDPNANPAATPGQTPPGGSTQPGSFLQAEKAKKSTPPAGVMSSMRWEPKLNPKVAGKINQTERPIRPVSRPVTNEPNETVTSDQSHPVTSTFRTAQDMIQAAKRNQGEQMSTRVADAASGAPAVASPDKRVDVMGVGGIMDDSNDSASHADAQVDVTGTGGTGVESVEADDHMTLQTAGEGTNDSGFNHDKTTDDSGKTKTWGDGKGKFKQKSPVTTEHPYWVNENKWSSMSPEQRTAITLIAGDDKVWPPDEISGGSAKQGVQPVDPVGKADKRVDVLEHVTSPANNSGPTKQWTGTDGNGVTRQQDPVTGDVIKSNGLPVGGQSMISAHMVTAMKLADTEIELGMLDKEYKYARIAELENWDTNVLCASLTAYTKVKTAGLMKTATTPKRLPSFRRATAASDTQAPAPVDESDLDAALFSR